MKYTKKLKFQNVTKSIRTKSTKIKGGQGNEDGQGLQGTLTTFKNNVEIIPPSNPGPNFLTKFGAKIRKLTNRSRGISSLFKGTDKNLMNISKILEIVKNVPYPDGSEIIVDINTAQDILADIEKDPRKDFVIDLYEQIRTIIDVMKSSAALQIQQGKSALEIEKAISALERAINQLRNFASNKKITIPSSTELTTGDNQRVSNGNGTRGGSIKKIKNKNKNKKNKK
jgi:hypothetical protein